VPFGDLLVLAIIVLPIVLSVVLLRTEPLQPRGVFLPRIG